MICLIRINNQIKNVYSQLTALKKLKHYPKFSTKKQSALFDFKYKNIQRKNLTDLLYIGSVGLFFLGLTFSAVPLYKIFCSKTGFGGTPKIVDKTLEKDKIQPLMTSKKIKVNFLSSTSKLLNWTFTPEQNYIEVYPGETALAFFKAKNDSDTERITGISSYNIIPDQAAPYFNKIQCFCFEEQTLEPGEEVDMPVFFYVDSDILEDPNTNKMNDIVLSYTFFKAK